MADSSGASSLLAPWTGPRGGAPAFDQAKVEDFQAALLAAIDQNRAEIEAIAANPEAPTFANTIAALEDSGRALSRVSAVYGVFTSTMNDAAMQTVEQEMAPVLAAFFDEVIQNGALFARIKAVHESADSQGLGVEEQRLAWRTHRRFTRHGAELSANEKGRMGEINQRLASLSTTFSQNQLADEEGDFLTLETEGDLAGLPPSLVAAAQASAKTKGLEGAWVITNTRSSMEPFLTYSSRRELRERGWRMWVRRGDNGGAHDNNEIISEILQLRAEKAKLLGYPSFAHWITGDQMAATPDAAMDLLLEVWAPAKARAASEIADTQALAQAENPGVKIEAWDGRYYAEKVRKARYDLDEDELKPYLQMEKLREAMFWSAGELFGLAFNPVSDLPVYHPDVRVWEVTRNGGRVGLWYFDPYARPGKSSGAWMSEYRTQERFAGEVTPIVSNNANFMKPSPGEIALISWSDAVTLFHEFGHALHGLNSAVAYPSLAGTNVARDFVELPSQLNERWLPTAQVLTRFCVHHETGEPMPKALAAKIEKARTFNKGFDTVEYLASAIVDMRAHLAAGRIEPRSFEKAVLDEIGMPREIVMRHRLPHFGHIFAGEGYAAGYYDYIWADTLTADAAEAFAEAPGGFFDKNLARTLLDDILSVGDTVDAAEAFRRFRGRDASVEPLMRDRGFVGA
jgi:peptidyl-dipeptidase Dcp